MIAKRARVIARHFRIYKESKIKAIRRIEVIADKGYQGIKTYHNNSRIPHKKPRKGQLNAEQKRENRSLAQVRIKVEHINPQLSV